MLDGTSAVRTLLQPPAGLIEAQVDHELVKDTADPAETDSNQARDPTDSGKDKALQSRCRSGNPFVQANDRGIIRFVNPKAVAQRVVKFGKARLQDVLFGHMRVEIPASADTSTDHER